MREGGGGLTRLAAVGLALVAAACTEEVAAPGVCPEYCPSGKIAMIDTVLTAISRDSAFGRPVGYANAHTSPFLIADSLPGVRDSRPIMRFSSLATRMLIGPDTTTGAVIGVDSLQLRLTIAQRDTATHSLLINLYLLPLAIDSATTYADVVGPFNAAPVRTVNLDTLLAKTGGKDPATGDSVLVDTLNKRVTIILKLDSAQAPYSAPDSGKLALGIRVSADTRATIRFASFEFTGLGPVMTWYLKVDSLGQAVAHKVQSRSAGRPGFDSFVFNPPAPALDATLTVGGIPAVRSILRVAFPRAIRDSGQIIRATLELITAVPPQGVAADSFGLVAHAVLADFGAKSPLDPTHADTTRLRIGPTDTVRVEIANILRFWAADTLAPTTLVLRQVPEGADFAEIRFFPSTDPTRRPVLHLTYAPRFPFGRP